ncbi:hypothetical protein B0T18DRAFT_102737 [Schizothecium vesticola]|uniref:Uncharacterized protein n=1 Tax=Schizothecium vesticola TaxID=314040 RepID=A0AA40K7Y2_9PEZI|nr:hypothetical protein B0T18DRAFT_102737 [Schizothecium vesticola]
MGVRVGCGQCLAGSMPAFSAHMIPRTWENPELKQLLGSPGQFTLQYSLILALGFSSWAESRRPFFFCAGAYLEPTTHCCHLLCATQKSRGRNKTSSTFSPSSPNFAGPVLKNPHLSLPPIPPPDLPKVEPYRILAALQGQGGLSRNRQARDSGLRHCSTPPITALVQHPRPCPVHHSVPTYLSARIRKAAVGFFRHHVCPVAVT